MNARQSPRASWMTMAAIVAVALIAVAALAVYALVRVAMSID